MKIIFRVFVTNCAGALWEHVPSSNFFQGMSRVQLGEPQFELGTQIPLGDEHNNSIRLSYADIFQHNTSYQAYCYLFRSIIRILKVESKSFAKEIEP